MQIKKEKECKSVVDHTVLQLFSLRFTLILILFSLKKNWYIIFYIFIGQVTFCCVHWMYNNQIRVFEISITLCIYYFYVLGTIHVFYLLWDIQHIIVNYRNIYLNSQDTPQLSRREIFFFYERISPPLLMWGKNNMVHMEAPLQ